MLIKLFRFLIIALLSAIAGAAYGVLHDQITFSISPEYFTKFKFYQFGLIEEYNEHLFSARQGAVFVGIMATWWIGLLFGCILGLTSFFIPNKKVFVRIFKAIGTLLLITAICGSIGYLYAKYSHTTGNGYIPENLTDLKSYIIVGCMHNFSYAGGGLGLLISLYLLLRKKSQLAD